MQTKILEVSALRSINTKGDIQMMETLMVAMVFMVVLVVALGFYFKFSSENVEEVCVQGAYPDCAVYPYFDPRVEYISSVVISTPVSLYYPLTDEYRFGRLFVEILQ